MSNRCAAPGCQETVRPSNLMCLPHWRTVPFPIKQAIYRNYTTGQTATTATPEYLKAMQAAIRSVSP